MTRRTVASAVAQTCKKKSNKISKMFKKEPLLLTQTGHCTLTNFPQIQFNAIILTLACGALSAVSVPGGRRVSASCRDLISSAFISL